MCQCNFDAAFYFTIYYDELMIFYTFAPQEKNYSHAIREKIKMIIWGIITSGINPNDKYPLERIAICDIRIPNLSRTIRVQVTDEKGNNMSDVAFSADEYKIDKQGNLVLKKGKPQRKKGFVQATATYHSGIYNVTVKSVNQTLALRKYIDGKIEYYDEYQIPPATDEINVKLTKTKMTSVEKWNQGFGFINDVLEAVSNR